MNVPMFLMFLLILVTVELVGALSYACSNSSHISIYGVLLINTAVMLGGPLVGYLFIPILREVEMSILILILSSWGTSLWGGVSGVLNRTKKPRRNRNENT